MWTWVGVMIVTAAAAAGVLGCSQQPSGTAAVIEESVLARRAGSTARR
jgi:hypothetical protein